MKQISNIIKKSLSFLNIFYISEYSQLKNSSTYKKIYFLILNFCFALWYFIFVKDDYSLKEIYNIILNKGSLIFFVGEFLLYFFIYNFASLYLFNHRAQLVPKSSNFLSYFLFVTIVYYICTVHYEIGISPDVENQMNQAITGNYNNWHPFMHTLLFYRIPMFIGGNNYTSVAFMHHLFIVLVITYACTSLDKFGFNRILIFLVLFFTLINVNFLSIGRYLLKDIPFGMGILFLTVSCMWIYYTKGEWLNKGRNIFLFCLSCFFVLFMRHNGIISFFATMLILILLYKNIRKRICIIFFSLLFAYFIITGPLYDFAGISSHWHPFAEKLGVTNNQIAYIIKNDGNVNAEEKEFINNYISIEGINKHYVNGNFNKVKWASNENGEKYYNADFLERNKTEYLKTWLSVISKNKRDAIIAYYYTILQLYSFKISIYSDQIFISMGASFLIAMFFVFIGTLRNKKIVLIAIPVLSNMLGVMLLITGNEIRFVFANVVVWLFIALFCMGDFKPILDGETKLPKKE